MNITIGPFRCPFEAWVPDHGRVFGRFAYDTETTLINEDRPELIPKFVVGTVSDGRQGYFLTRETVLPFFKAHDGLEYICHNAAFDLKVTQQLFGDRRDIYADVEEDRVYDTLILKRLLSLATEGHTARGEASLDKCVKDHLGVDLKKHAQDLLGRHVRTNFGQFLYKPLNTIPRPYLEYAAGDALATWHLFQQLHKEIRGILQKSSGVYGYVNGPWLKNAIAQYGPLTHHVQLRASILMGTLTINGIAIDAERRQQKVEALTATIESCGRQLNERNIIVGGPGSGVSLQTTLEQLHRDHPGTAMRRSPKGDKWSSRGEDLVSLTNLEPALADYLNYRKAEKLLSVYLNKMDRPRLHARFGYLLASGRTYCGEKFFNLQNLPREDGLTEGDQEEITVRGCFVPSPGNVFIDTDYSQIELVVLAYVLLRQLRYGDTLTELINGGDDIHRRIAALVLDKPPSEVTKVERNGAKAISFGRPGGMGAATLQQIAKATYGQNLTQEEVEDRIAAYHRLVPELDRYLKDEVDAGLVIAKTLELTPGAFQAATGTGKQAFSPDDGQPCGWLGGMLLKALKHPSPATRDGRPYSGLELSYLWSAAQRLPVSLTPENTEKLRNQHPDEALWKEVRDWAGGRAFFTVTGRIRAKASYCASRNGLFQGPAADGMILGLWEIWRAGYKIVASIHDENVVEVPADGQALHHRNEIERLMKEGMLGVIPGMRVAVESLVTKSLDKTDVDPRYLEDVDKSPSLAQRSR